MPVSPARIEASKNKKKFFDISALEDETATLYRNVGNQKTATKRRIQMIGYVNLLASQEI